MERNTHNLKFTPSTLWFTGLSASGKTTLSISLKKKLESEYVPKDTVFILDGDVIRNGLNKDLGFSHEDRTENIRRIAEVSKLFNMSGRICIVAFISPFTKDRNFAKKIHEDDGYSFKEVFIGTSLETCESRDPKGLYKKARAGLIPMFTGVSDVYEAPENPDLVIKTENKAVEESVDEIIDFLYQNNIIKPKTTIKNDTKSIESLEETKVEIVLGEEELQWLQVLELGWSNLKCFMNEEQLLETLHFKKTTYNLFSLHNSDLNNASSLQGVPIICPISEEDVNKIKNASSVSLKSYVDGNEVAILSKSSTFKFRKEEICTRLFGTFSKNHPKIQKYMEGPDFLLTGDHITFTNKIQLNDGLDHLRLSARQIKELAKSKNADVLFAFQLRNPLHNGHILLIKDTANKLKEMGYKNPVFLLHPLGGWTKDDDVPLDVRIKQHEILIEQGILDKDNTILAIWPSPMFYAGPSEVLWHFASRAYSGVDYMIVGRDPAGIKHPDDENLDLYDPIHGQKVLNIAAKNFDMVKILPFKMAVYNKESKCMEYFDESKKEQYDFISGTKMRNYAKTGVLPPDGFMDSKGWDVLAEYYKKI